MTGKSFRTAAFEHWPPLSGAIDAVPHSYLKDVVAESREVLDRDTDGSVDVLATFVAAHARLRYELTPEARWEEPYEAQAFMAVLQGKIGELSVDLKRSEAYYLAAAVLARVAELVFVLDIKSDETSIVSPASGPDSRIDECRREVAAVAVMMRDADRDPLYSRDLDEKLVPKLTEPSSDGLKNYVGDLLDLASKSRLGDLVAIAELQARFASAIANRAIYTISPVLYGVALEAYCKGSTSIDTHTAGLRELAERIATKAIPPREQTALLNSVGALLEVILFGIPDGTRSGHQIGPAAGVEGVTHLIDAIAAHYKGFDGLSQSNLARKLPAALLRLASS